MMERETSIQEKIMLATINCIEKEGILSLTTRGIAKEADVNVAAINYYFGTKEKLVDLTFDYIEKDFVKDTLAIIDNDNSNDESMVRQLLNHIYDGCINYPNLMRAVFYDPFINNRYEGRFVKIMNSTMEKLHKRLTQNSSESNLKENYLIILQMISSSLFLGIFPGYFNVFSKIDLSNQDVRKQYVEDITKNFMKSIRP